MSMTIKQLPETERPYEKLELYGEKTLSNAELLAIIIKTGTKEETSVQIAQKVLNLNETKQYGMNFLKDITLEELMQIKGIGKVKAIQLKAVAELTIRMSKPSNYKKVKIKNPRDIARFFMEELRYERREIVKVVILNERNEILKIKELSLGGEGFVNCTIKEVMTEAVKMRAPKIVLIHNHPSGDPTPSEVDVEYTELSMKVAGVLGIEFMDHIVIGNGKYISILSEMASKIAKDLKTKDGNKQKEGKDRG